MKLIPYRRRFAFPLADFQGTVNHLFNRFCHEQDEPHYPWVPAIDMAQTDDVLIVKAEVPGLRAEDIELSVQDGTLSISGDKKDTAEQSDEHYYHVERRYGNFHRTIPLPSDVDASEIEAECADGVLTITLPKAEETKPHRIAVKSK